MTAATDREPPALVRAPMNRREWLAMAGAGAAALAMPGALHAQGAQGGKGPARRGGVLRVSAPTNPSSLDPATGGSGTDHAFLWPLFDTLVEWDYETLEPVPGMASWTYPDPKTMVLTLKPGIVFHDGTPCDAEAVRFNLERGRSDARSNIKADLSSVGSVEATGPLEVTVRLTRPDTALPAILSDRAGMIASPTAIRQFGNEHDRKGIGAGPWKLVEWADNQKVSVVRHDAYWRDDRGFVDGIEFSIIPELATGLRSVVAGQNHLAYHLPPRLKPIIDRSKTVELVSGPTLYCFQVYLNLAHEPLNDVRVRRAMNHAIDRDAFVKAGLSGLGEPAGMFLPKAHWAYDAEVAKLYPHDLDKARALMAEAGFKDGFDLTIGGYIDPDSVRRGEIIMDQLGKVGVRLRFTNGSVPEISAQYFGQEKKFSSLLAAWTGRPDPSMTYDLMFMKDAYFNAGRVEVSPELTELLARSREREDLAFRKDVFARIQRIVMEQALAIPLAFRFDMTAVSNDAVGYRSNLLGKPKYEFVSLKA